MCSRRSVAFLNRAQPCVATSNHRAWLSMRTPRFSAGPRSARTAADLRLKKSTRFLVQRLKLVRGPLTYHDLVRFTGHVAHPPGRSILLPYFFLFTARHFILDLSIRTSVLFANRWPG